MNIMIGLDNTITSKDNAVPRYSDFIISGLKYISISDQLACPNAKFLQKSYQENGSFFIEGNI